MNKNEDNIAIKKNKPVEERILLHVLFRMWFQTWNIGY